MKVLFVAGACPYPPHSGAALRTYNLLKRLSKRHDITLVTPISEQNPDDLRNAFDNNLERVVPVPSPGINIPILRALSPVTYLCSSLPYIVRAHRNEEMDWAILHAMSDRKFDVLHCDSISVVPSIPTQVHLPKVFNAHNVEAVIWERYIREERRFYVRPILQSQLRKVARFEAQLPYIFDSCIAVSEEDREELRNRYGIERVDVVSNGVDVDYYDYRPDSESHEIAFIGSLDWRPNQDGLRWLVRDIMPHLRALVPDIQVTIVGRRPPGWLSDVCSAAGMQMRSDVPDVRPHLASAALSIVPLRIGGGSRLKILEAMSLGRCVVSTTIGAEGLNVVDGEHICLADAPNCFAEAVALLLLNRERRVEMTAAARRKVEAEYSWDIICRSLEDAWNSVRRPLPQR